MKTEAVSEQELLDMLVGGDWPRMALSAVRRTAEKKLEFISDDVWLFGELPHTREDRALGPVLLKACRKGWIRKTELLRPSIRSRGSGKPVWRSLIFQGSVLR